MSLRRDPRVIVPLVIAELVSATLAMRDLGRRPDEAVRGPKAFWRVLIVLNAGNSLPYWIFGRRR